MKIVIDLPEEIIADAKTSPNFFPTYHFGKLLEAVRNGTPLPKVHGRLGDLDALRKEISSWGMNDYEPSDFIDEIDMADVIIEADKESEAQE